MHGRKRHLKPPALAQSLIKNKTQTVVINMVSFRIFYKPTQHKFSKVI